MSTCATECATACATACNTDCVNITNQPAVQSTFTSTITSNNLSSTLKEQLKTLSIEERHVLLSTINMEEQQKKIKDEEYKLAQCPVSKQVQGMKFEIQDLKMELQKLKNKVSENCVPVTTNTNTNTMKCPYSIFRVNQDYLPRNHETDYDYDYDLCNEMSETCSSTWSWWSIIMFVIFILLVMTAKPPKHCEQFFTTTM